MILTKKQEEGLKIAVERYINNEPYTCISGYAGSGKSTLISYIVAALNLYPEAVCYIAYTGKAATVLRQKGCPNAVTAHKLLYRSVPQKDGTFKFIAKDKLEEEYDLIVVDEISMLPKAMWNLLLSHKIHVIACGDPGQLPPVNAADDNEVLKSPHIFLDEIMRQAAESEIIQLSLHIREGKPLSTFKCNGKEVQIFTQKDVVDGMYSWADQIICATNNKRNEINNFVRYKKGFAPETPSIGDKIISLKNHWDCISSRGDWALTNGAIGEITYFSNRNVFVPFYISENPIEVMTTNMKLEDNDNFNQLLLDYKCLTTGVPALSSKQQYQMNNSKMCPDAPYEFAYAYAITCWKAQGSEWNKVLGFEENFPFDKETHKKYLYTLTTRASEKLVLIRK